MRRQIIWLSRLLLEGGGTASPGVFAEADVAAFLSPAAVLALEGDAGALRLFSSTLEEMAGRRWGLDRFGTRSGLNDAFALRSVVEAYEGLLGAGLIPVDHLRAVGPWLYAHARMRSDGSIANLPGFQPWHQRNQNVPASLVYLVAGLLERDGNRDSFDLESLRNWADSQMAGWDLTWRTPDDSWLYQYIWILGAYYHARERRPGLLASENARKSFDFYKTLALPGGRPIVFGDSSPHETLGPCVACALGASLFGDAALLYIAEELLARAVEAGVHPYLIHRAPEMYRLYAYWPRGLTSARPVRDRSVLMVSPLPAEGWATGGTPYNEEIKAENSLFPNRGRSFSSYDDVYQIQDREKYLRQRPDKLLFARAYDPESMTALVDFRAQGVHDHPDALGVTTLVDQGVPWLVETVYEPRGYNRLRWLHNVPLFLPRYSGAEGLKHYEADTWKEPDIADVRVFSFGAVDVVASRLRRGGFDYVGFDRARVEVERYFVYLPDCAFAVIDRMTLESGGGATVGQIWHTASGVERGGGGYRLSKGNRRLSLSLAASGPSELTCATRCPPETPSDPFYFDQPVCDILNHASFPEVPSPFRFSFAACFSRTSGFLEVVESAEGTRVDSGFFRLRIGGFAELFFESKS